MSPADAVATAHRPPAHPDQEKALSVGQDAEGKGTNSNTHVEERTAAMIASQAREVEAHRETTEGHPFVAVAGTARAGS